MMSAKSYFHPAAVAIAMQTKYRGIVLAKRVLLIRSREHHIIQAPTI